MSAVRVRKADYKGIGQWPANCVAATAAAVLLLAALLLLAAAGYYSRRLDLDLVASDAVEEDDHASYSTPDTASTHTVYRRRRTGAVAFARTWEYTRK